MCNYMTKAEYKELKEVPDPYFGGSEGFEKVSRNFIATLSCACNAACETGGCFAGCQGCIALVVNLLSCSRFPPATMTPNLSHEAEQAL